MKPNITIPQLAKALALLEAGTGPMTAIEIAEELGLGGCRETKRRHVREIVKELRDKGNRVIGTIRDGYYLARDDKQWRDYLESRQVGAKQVLGKTHKEKKLAYPDGTLALFNRPVGVGAN